MWLDQFVIWVAWLVEGMAEMVLVKEILEKCSTFLQPCTVVL